MDKTSAQQLSKKLRGRSCDGWIIGDVINHGKSAVVIKTSREGRPAAIKIFDQELIERFGGEIQQIRLERELGLVGQSHPNVVEIIGGGFWKAKKCYYVIMEYLPWKNLAEVLTEIPAGKERDIIAQVAAGAKFLEGLELCHRDIKPENIAISPGFDRVKLLDLGVVRPMGKKNESDKTGSRAFVGTLRYSPPEFLLREEEETTEGFRALTFYQIGGVLHDLIMRRPLFSEYENPYAKLVNAVQHETPRIESSSVSPALVEIAEYCLHKTAGTRLKLVTWDSFTQEPAANNTIADIKSRIRKRLTLETEKPANHTETTLNRLTELRSVTEAILAGCRIECTSNRDVIPPFEIVGDCADQAEPFTVSVHFDPSISHKLARYIAIHLRISWLDAAVIEIRAGAAVSAAGLPDATCIPDTETVLFRRAASNLNAMVNDVCTIIYVALEMAAALKRPIKNESTVAVFSLKEKFK